MKNDSDVSPALVPPVPIRVETALSRYPVHRLAKQGDIVIDIRERSENGEVAIKWEVTPNSKYGQPGPLAYKLDTLVINRRIEEATRPIPRTIRLGGLTEICQEIGLSDSGGNTNQVRKALIQNAFVGITAKVRYKRSDGAEQSLEAAFTRYNVIFTGEKLLSGHKADAVYIILNDIYMQVLNGAMTRPLDYEYLKGLPPAAQRFYELLSYQIYAALKNDRPRARLLYSELCRHAPLTRHFAWERARKQMDKVHAPHRKSGYIARFEHEATVDAEGRPDWVLFYTPGPKARAEYQTFTQRGGPAVPGTAPRALGPPAAAEAEALAASAPPEPDPSPLVAELTRRGVTRATARELAAAVPPAVLAAKIAVFDWLVERRDKRIARSPAGYLVRSVRDDYVEPHGYVAPEERARRAAADQARDRAAAEDRQRARGRQARERAERRAIAAHWEGLSEAERAQLDAEAWARADPETRALPPGPVRRMALALVRDTLLQERLRAAGTLPPAD